MWQILCLLNFFFWERKNKKNLNFSTNSYSIQNRMRLKCFYFDSKCVLSCDKCVLEFVGIMKKNRIRCFYLGVYRDPTCVVQQLSLIWFGIPEKKSSFYRILSQATREKKKHTQPYRKVFNTHIEKFAYEPRLSVLLLLLLFLLDAVFFFSSVVLVRFRFSRLSYPMEDILRKRF